MKLSKRRHKNVLLKLNNRKSKTKIIKITTQKHFKTMLKSEIRMTFYFHKLFGVISVGTPGLPINL